MDAVVRLEPAEVPLPLPILRGRNSGQPISHIIWRLPQILLKLRIVRRDCRESHRGFMHCRETP